MGRDSSTSHARMGKNDVSVVGIDPCVLFGDNWFFLFSPDRVFSLLVSLKFNFKGEAGLYEENHILWGGRFYCG